MRRHAPTVCHFCLEREGKLVTSIFYRNSLEALPAHTILRQTYLVNGLDECRRIQS